MTTLELRRDGAVHSIRVQEGGSLEQAAKTLERWDRDWRRGKRKAAKWNN